MNLLEFENLGRRFGGRWALKNISGSIHEGEQIALLGPNGAGKTTLLYLLAGVMRPDSGTIRRQHKTMALLSHQPMLYSRLSAWDNLVFFLRLAGQPMGIARSLAREALQFFGLLERRFERPDTFSRGMLQRLLLARLSALRPELVFLDEPFTGLDQQAQKLLENILSRRGLPELGWSFTTLLLVEHDSARALSFTQKTWHLEKGLLQQEKTG